MKVIFKKRDATVSVKTGFSWPFLFALICPLVGAIACLRRHLYF
ncbi:hypothetical protein [Paraburkholderia solisilvae]|uniref:Uncharacterized protein n=1 Tax=Paraburkholderia solisilvae TaxID=624376 RepID=A0A6J5ES78_9BURK|nr:hypothetical protein [Paraburkholderia solisilvae]CAB3769053.1 hypothetical protein LMG29739_05451 [Paraburkholderia solisilvae]